MITPALTGFATAFALILAIGAQNAFVLRQGLAGAHVFPLCLLCALSDAILITAGVLGFGAIVALYPMLPQIMAWGGAAFLLVYGALRLWAAWQGDYALQIAGQTAGLWATLATGAAFTWLNPHVYLDTLGLIGAISTQFTATGAKLAFGIGAVSASFVFFFSLGYGARLLAPVMTSARAWQLLDVLIGLVMWALAFKLLS
ncbi:LysE/ArgO family amino acid transporter [Yoonia sediminilitoris]|uniref:L-lysine exporter family protein LysE/ArgO n=1 Tax=Yoonia sediminilitoris TaxID=1286148 RepID=A0A2T6KCY5_9RHOB|nr:LysE/ArgO family amino acid transporter [Yoonia sediminilitoris]PUB12822.1 L-lysine exporter family protein LysE/ArgO [Yoonia sediminilitoris]RCW94301.1 L-lysine exporter family protein LysE/ArgO [Yoonia sediminilitoris]